MTTRDIEAATRSAEIGGLKSSQRFMSSLQYGFVAYVRHDWAFPYSAQAVRVQGILTT